jgi:hypothetical protein
MARYTIVGYEEYPVLSLHPVHHDHGVPLPGHLYDRWLHARTALDIAQRDVIAHLRASGGRIAIPEELWELQDRADAAIAEDTGNRDRDELSARL